MKSKTEKLITKRDLARHGISQADLARALKVNRSSVSRWIAGKRTPKTEKFREALSQLHKRAKRLRVTHNERTLTRRRNRIFELLRKLTEPVLRPTPPSPPGPPGPPAHPGPPTPPALMSYVELRKFVIENLRTIKRFTVNGNFVNDTIMGWLSDHKLSREAKAVNEGDTNNYWRILLDYTVALDEDGILSITFDSSIVL